MTTLGIIVGTIGAYALFSIAKAIGRWLKRQRIAQEEAEKIIKQYGKNKDSGSN
jgi:hypothetical protein